MNNKIIQNNKESYGDGYQSHLLEQYSLYLKGIDKASDRRQRTNDFFLTVNTATLAFMGVMNKAIENDSPLLVLVVSLFGIILSLIWYRLIKSYRNINRGKYQVLHKLEEQLPAIPYKLEWDILANGKNKKIYKPITHVEISVPVIFTVLYSLIIVAIYIF